MKFTNGNWVVFLMMFIISTQAAYAQDFGASLIVGSVFSQVDGDQIGGYNKLGIQTGIMIDRKVNENWKIGAQLLFTQKGSRKKIAVDDPVRDIFILKFNYLELPLLAIYKKGDFSFRAGPSIGYLINAKRDTGLGFTELTDLHKTEIALRSGVTYHFNNQLAFDIGHSSSLLRIGNPYQGGLYLFTRNGLYNRLFTASLTYTLKTGNN